MDPHITETTTRLDRPALPTPDHETKALPPGPTFRQPKKKDPGSPKKGRPWLWILILLLLAGGYYFWSKRTPAAATQGDTSKGGRGGRGRGGGTPPVVAVKARKGDIGVYYTGTGNVIPINTVTVKTRVDGQLMSVAFKEGDMVKQGDTLAEIDPRPFQAQLTQFEGQLAKDEATLQNARLDQKRYETLIAQNAIAGQQLDTQKATVQQLEGTVKADQGQIEGVKLNILYSHITAPITGRIGLRLVDPGNIVHAGDSNGLLVITQIQPISVIFTIPEDQLQVVLKKLHAGQRLQVDAYDREMQNKIAQGALTTVDNQIDQTTGTLKLRATFENGNSGLFPNQFVNARLLVELKHGVVLLSSAAIQRNSQMTYVYLVKPDSTVTVKQITPGVSEGNDTEVTSGLAEGDVVVMTGVDKLQENQKVVVHMDGEKEPSEPAGKSGGRRGGGGRRQGK